MNYSLDNSSWSAAIPTATAAGDYTVYYKVIGDNNHTDFIPSPNTVAVTIAKAASSVSVAPAAVGGLVYDGSLQTLVTAGTASGGELQYKLDDGAYSTALPQATEAGTYTVWYKVVGDANHSDLAETSFTVTIAGPDNMVLTANEDPNHAGDYYSTFYHSAVQYALPAGVEAYVATITGDALLLTRIAGAGDVLPADNAVILLAHSSSIILTPSLSAPVTFSVTNNLLGTDVPISPAPANCYVLSGHSDDDLVHAISFYRYSGTLKAHKAYAIYGGGGAGAPLRLPFVFNSATGMESLQSSAVSSQKVLRNGELIIIHGETEFNAQGQRIR